MTKTVLKGLVLAAALTPAIGLAQAPKSATYITDEEVKAVNATPGVDRTIKVVDIGPENFAVGVIHRGASGGGGARGAAPAGGARRVAQARRVARRGGSGARRAVRRTIDRAGNRRRPRHDRANQQTEGYLIISGGGTLVTGGKIVNGRKSAPESTVTKELNGPSCSGTAVGADLVRRWSRPATSSSSRRACRTAGPISATTSTIELPSVGARAGRGLHTPIDQEVAYAASAFRRTTTVRLTPDTT